MMTKKEEEFTKELIQLLKKYDAQMSVSDNSICIEDSDTLVFINLYGIIDADELQHILNDNIN